MIKPKSAPLISGTQFVAIVVLTISIFLIVDFGRRTTAGYYASQAEERLKREIQAELDRQVELEARRDYAASDEYVEEWARTHAHMILPGDQPMFLLTPQSPQARVELEEPVQVSPDAEPFPNWYRWLLLFFDEETQGY